MVKCPTFIICARSDCFAICLLKVSFYQRSANIFARSFFFFHKIPCVITRHIKIKRGSLKYKVRNSKMLRCIYTCLSKRRQILSFFCVHDIKCPVLSTSLQGKIYFGILRVQSRQRGRNKYKRKVALLPFYNKMYKLILSARFKCPASNCVARKLDTPRKKSSVSLLLFGSFRLVQHEVELSVSPLQPWIGCSAVFELGLNLFNVTIKLFFVS